MARRSSSRQSRRGGFFTIFYCNHSSWGPALKAYVQDSDYDTIATVEPHLAGLSKMNEAKAHLKDLGYTSHFAEALPHRDSVAAGGSSLHAKLRYRPVELVSATIPLPGVRLPGAGKPVRSQ